MVLVSLAVVSLNAFFMQKMEIGLISTVAFLSSIAVVCGLVLYDDDPWTLRFLKGVFTILALMTIGSVFLLYINQFSLLSSVLIACFLSVSFLVFFMRKKHWSAKEMHQEVHEHRYRRVLSWLVVISLFGVILCFLFFVLFNSRTAEPMNGVWSTIPVPTFQILLFSCSIMIVFLALFSRGKYPPLLMILGISILIEGIYYLVWYPSLYGDPLTTLGTARYVERTGAIFDWNYLFSNRLWMDIITGRGYPNFAVQLTRLLSLDIYWVHNIALPLVWSLILPISLYEITCLLINEKPSSYPREALFSAFAGAMLVPVLIIWGANPTGNTLGFLFLFFSLPLTLRWVTRGGRLYWCLAFVAVLASFLTHPMPGIFGIVFLYGATVFHEATSAFEKVAGVSVSIMGLPLVLVFAGSSFLPENLVSIQSVLSFESAMLTFPMLLSFAGLFLSLKFEKLNRKVLWLLVGFYVIVAVDFYISQYGLTDVAYGAERALVIAEFLFTPFIGILISSLMRIFETRKAISHKRNSVFKSSFRKAVNPKIIVAVLLALLISLQSVVSVYQAFPQNEVGIAPTWYEMEAISYINSTATRRFVVVSDTLFSNLAIGLLGIDWGFVGERQKGSFGYPQWEFPIQQDFTSMVNEPSLEILDDAIEFASAEEAYFVISIRNPKFNETVEKVLEMLPVERIFGDGKLYIFKYPVPAFAGEGPMVRVVYDEGASTENFISRYFYVIRKDVTYSIEVTGHSAYNVSDFPQYWLFKNVTVNNVKQVYDNSSDINNFIFLRGLNPSDTLRVSWKADEEYPVCGWKEDSFRNGWGPYPAYSYKLEPIISTEGGILSLSGDYKDGSPLEAIDFYYSRSANVSTDEYQFITIRWRSLGKAAVSYVYFDDGTNQEILPFGSSNPFWSVTRVNLVPEKRIKYVMVGLSNIMDMANLIGVQTMQVDYILICSSKS